MCARSSRRGRRTSRRWPARRRSPTPAGVVEDDAALMCYTSGTTGRPKGAVLTHGGLVASTLSWIHEMGAGPGRRVALRPAAVPHRRHQRPAAVPHPRRHEHRDAHDGLRCGRCPRPPRTPRRHDVDLRPDPVGRALPGAARRGPRPAPAPRGDVGRLARVAGDARADGGHVSRGRRSSAPMGRPRCPARRRCSRAATRRARWARSASPCSASSCASSTTRCATSVRVRSGRSSTAARPSWPATTRTPRPRTRPSPAAGSTAATSRGATRTATSGSSTARRT